MHEGLLFSREFLMCNISKVYTLRGQILVDAKS